MGGRYRLVSGAHAHTGTLLLTRSPDTTRTRRGALKHLFGDRPESVPRPQRAQHTHFGARGGGHSGTQRSPRRRRLSCGARSARFFSGTASAKHFPADFGAHRAVSAAVARGAQMLAGCEQLAWSKHITGARSARKIFEEELLKEFLPLSGAAQSAWNSRESAPARSVRLRARHR